jgi:hypothetical protein
MAIDIYVSLRSSGSMVSPRAVEILAANRPVTGIEVSGELDDPAPIRRAGLLLGIHNPLPAPHDDLADILPREWFVNGWLADRLRRIDTGFAGFHLGYRRPGGLLPPAAIRRNGIRNIGSLAALTDKKVIFETPSFFKKHRDSEWAESFAAVTSPEFIAELCRVGECGYLFDAAHVLITSETVGNRSYIADMIGVCSPYVRQLHVSVPAYDSGGNLQDVHGFCLDGRRETDRILAICRAVIAGSPSLTALTLEMIPDPAMDPSDFFTRLGEQAGLLAERLGIIPSPVGGGK